MANNELLKASICNVIKANYNEEITGDIMQQTLLAMVAALGVGYQFVGIATPSMNPGTPDQNVFYIASTAGTYTNFGGLVLADGEISILKYNGAWSKDSTRAASLEKVSQLGQEVDELDEQLNGGTAEYPYSTTAAYLDVALADIGATVGVNVRFSFSGSATLSTSITQRINGTNGTNQDIVSLGGGMYEVAWNSQANPNCDTMRFWLNGDGSEESHFVFFGDSTPGLVERIEGIEESVQDLSEEVDERVGNVEEELKNVVGDDIIETLTWTNGKRVGLGGSSDSKIANATSDYSISNFIKNPGGAYKLRVSGVHSRSNIQTPSVNYYDADQKHIGYEYIDGSAELTVPVGVSYVLISQCDVTEYPTANVSVSFVVAPMFASQNELDDLTEDFENAESYSDKGYRTATDADFTQSIDGHFKIENGSLYGKRGSSDPTVMMVLNDGIKAIEFEIASLWDSNLISLVFGLGVDTGNNKPCFAQAYLNTSARPNDTGYVVNKDYDGNASAGQSTSLWGQGHFSGDYRRPQVKPYAVAVGDKCRIELIDGHFFKASVYNPTSGCWDFWWCLDTDGTWSNPKMGWTTRRAIGFEITFAAITNWKELIKNIRIVSEDGKTSGIYSELSNDFPERKQWVAIGDSITEIDKNNGLSYVGYAQRKLGFKVDNQGKGGWTIYKLWRDRATAGWEDAVSAINDGDLVTILAGTNDFDTASFSTPVSDEAMDAAGSPHPRFGTADPTSEDAKDPHTTLGCLRLMIERILTLKPGARLSVFSPFYREKGRPVGQTSWDKLYINSDGHTIYDYADAIYSVAREYNLPAYNTCRDCGINAMTLAAYTYDDLHIGQVGGELIGDYVAKRIS